MGVAGSGKSSQGRLLADELGLPWVSTGEFLRMLIAGPRRKAMLRGELLKDSEIIGLIQKIFAMVATDTEFVLDGFPRSFEQADWLLAQKRHEQLDITAVIHLKADKDVVKKRLLERGRQDDTESAITERFEEYENRILPILNQFKEAGVPVQEVDGDQSIEAVQKDVKNALNQAKSENDKS